MMSVLLIKQLGFIFVLSFVLNLVWENLHALLYTHYKGGPITEWILLHATLMDAIFITCGAAIIFLVPMLRGHDSLIIPMGLILAVLIEWWALGSGRWAYNALMPIIPIINTGLTPTIQLALLGYISLVLAKKIF